MRHKHCSNNKDKQNKPIHKIPWSSVISFILKVDDFIHFDVHHYFSGEQVDKIIE
jgi:hypothetical protein